jgi:exodeoxyribonuclease VII small subunit
MARLIRACYNVRTMTKSAPKKTAIDFQKQFASLEKITEDFEAGKYSLEVGLKKFEEGLALAQELKDYLATVENKIESIKQNYNELTSENGET